MSSITVAAVLSCIVLAGCDDAPLRLESGSSGREWICSNSFGDSTEYLRRIGCLADWDALDGPPMNTSHGPATAVKFLFSLDSGTLWFPNSVLYPLHWDFASSVFGIPPSKYYTFWIHQYSDRPERRYALGTVTRYGANLWTMQLFPGDDLSSDRLARVYRAIADSCWFGRSLLFLPANEAAASRAKIAGIPTASIEDVLQGREFQSMNPGVAYGTLVRARWQTLSDAEFTPRDIVLTDGLPNDLPVVAGVVTTDFQTPLSHVNVLSMNRGTPNMALRGAWTDSAMVALEGRLVRLEVLPDAYSIRAANLEEARAFWDTHGPGPAPTLPLDTSRGLVPILLLGRSQLPRVGAKAANFGELAKLAASSSGAWKVPEGAFAIPVAAYLEHLRANGLDTVVERILSDSSLKTDASRRKAALSDLQTKIVRAPVDPMLLQEVEATIRSNGTHTRMRFRSSTNAEDLPEFNGAGLYSSFTGDLADAKKPVADAIRKVWASLWNRRAFEEREYYRIDQRRVAMGVLVHRSFPDEGANGVAVTRNLYKDDYVGYVINAQAGDVSVVDPPEGVTTEQLIYYPFLEDYLGEPSIEWISKSSLTGGAAVLRTAELVRLAQALKTIQARFCPLLSKSCVDWYTYGMDVEFKFDGPDRTLYIKQARPLPE